MSVTYEHSADGCSEKDIIVFHGATNELSIGLADESGVATHADLTLVPPQTMDPVDALHACAMILDTFTNSDSFIHVDENDIVATLSQGSIAKIMTLKQSDEGLPLAEDIAAQLQGQDLSDCQNAVIDVQGSPSMKLHDATLVTETIRKHLANDATVIWGLNLDDRYERIQAVAICVSPNHN